MATEQLEDEKEAAKKLLSSYLGLTFTVFLGLLPKSSISLQSQYQDVSLKLIQAQEQLKQMKSRRREDSKANARVVEIFATHRNSWQQEEKRLINQIDAAADEIAHLRARVAELEKSEEELKGKVEELSREVGEREEMINFMSRKTEYGDFDEDCDDGEAAEREEEEKESGGCGRNRGYCGEESGGECYVDSSRFGKIRVSEECFLDNDRNGEEFDALYGQHNGFNPDLLATASKFWAERASLWQDVQCESIESMYPTKHFVARRESPWKVDGEATGVSSKLKLLEQELSNLEKIGKSDSSKVPSLLRKQAKRYQNLAGKIDDLCRRMQASDPCEPTLSPEFRTQRQREFLLEAFRLQERASETGQKLTALQTETVKNHLGDEIGNQAKLSTRRSLDSVRNNFKEIQRNLEIWLARICGDLEGIISREGASSRIRECYISRYPFVQ